MSHPDREKRLPIQSMVRSLLSLFIAVWTITPALKPASSPYVSPISPPGESADGLAFGLNVYGSGFSGKPVVLWKGSARPTTVISQTHLIASISSTDITAPGTAQISVVNGKPSYLQSNSVAFSIASRTGNGVTTVRTANPTSVNFGNLPVGSKGARTLTLNNTGTGSVTVSQANVVGTGFSISVPSFPLTLSAGQSTSFTATFSPTAIGSVTGSISIVSNASGSPIPKGPHKAVVDVERGAYTRKMR